MLVKPLTKLLPTQLLSRPLRLAAVCAASLLATASLAQTIINVGPGQTIQSAILAANPGDTVLVAPGTYAEHIDFLGKAITVTSSGGPSVTTITGGGTAGIATVDFLNHETSASVLSGFTITGGGDMISGGVSDGGVFIGGNGNSTANAASPTIQSNTITGNYCHNLHIDSATPTLQHNDISNVLQSTQSQSLCSFLSAVFLGGTPANSTVLGPTLLGNVIENNLVGPGIILWSAQNVLIMNNNIHGNFSTDAGSALLAANNTGTVLFQNLIYDNNSSCGGAIAFQDGNFAPDGNPSILIANNTIVNNVTPKATAGSTCTQVSQLYPGPYTYGADGPGSFVVGNIISGSTFYPAVACTPYSLPSLSQQPTFEYNILYNATGPFFGYNCADVSNSNSNMVVDPQFVDPASRNYHLLSTSPAIDHGQNTILQTISAITGKFFTQDYDGNPRIQGATSSTCAIDIGAFEYPGVQSICPTVETLVSSINPSSPGESVTFTAQLTSPSGIPTGTVQFFDYTSSLATEPVSTSGSSTYTTSTLATGNHNISAMYQPTGVFTASTASLTQVVSTTATTTVLSCSPQTIPALSNAFLTVTVRSTIGSPTGSVAFTDNGYPLSTQPLVGGAASLTYTGNTAGIHTLAATYVPDGIFSPSVSYCRETVVALPTTANLTANPTSFNYGSSVMLTATVAPATQPGPSTPTGTVTFLSGSTAVGTATLVNGVASVTANGLNSPSDNLSCFYSGNTVYASSYCYNLTVFVKAATSALTLTSSNSPAPSLSPITFTATLTSNGQPAGAGNVIYLTLNGQVITLTTDATGSAYYTISTLLPGQYPVKAHYTATTNLLSSDASFLQLVTATPTRTGLTVTPNPAYFGQQVTMTAVVQSINSPLPPSGSVSFLDGNLTLGTQPLSPSGAATFTTVTPLAPGTHPLTAIFNYDSTVFATSSSPVVQEVIIPNGFTVTLVPSTLTLAPGAAGTVGIQLAAVGQFTGPLSLTYGPLPAYATASINPTNVTLQYGSGGSASSTLSLNTLLKAANTIPPRPGSREAPAVFAAFTLLLLPLSFIKRRRAASLLTLAFMALALQAATGCTNAYYTAKYVAPGTYQIPVIATDTNHNTATATLTLIVTP